jgi:hypothetical protein
MIDGQNLFERFGGVRPMADKLRERPTTVQGWKDHGRVPATKQPAVLERAVELGLDVTAHDVIYPLRRRATASEEHVGGASEAVACGTGKVSHHEAAV